MEEPSWIASVPALAVRPVNPLLVVVAVLCATRDWAPSRTSSALPAIEVMLPPLELTLLLSTSNSASPRRM